MKRLCRITRLPKKANAIMLIINTLMHNNILDSYVVIDTLLDIALEYETLTPKDGINRLYTIAAIAYQLSQGQEIREQ